MGDAFARRVIFRTVLLLALALTPCVRAAEGPLNLEALDVQVAIEAGKQVAVAKGEARFRGDDFLLTADEIRYTEATETLSATGHVTFTRGAARLLADRLAYRRTDGSFTAEDIRLGSPPYFAQGASAEGTRQEITVRQARVTFGEPGPWQPTLTADTLFISPGQHLRTEKAAAGVGLVRPFQLPRFEQELAQPLPLRVSLDGGYRQSLGAFIDAGALVPVRPGLRVGGDLAFYTARGVLIGPGAAYGSPGEPDRLRGLLQSGYINDHGDRKTDLLGQPIPEDRAFVDWKHQQTLAPNLTLNGQVIWWQDSEVTRDFRPDSFFRVQEPDTFIEAAYAGTNYFISVFTRLQPNHYHRVQERLPEIRFDLLPLAVGPGFYERASASIAALREDPPSGGPKRRSTRLDGYYALLRPIAVKEWLAITPTAGGRITHYTHTEGAADPRSGSYTRVLGELGIDAALRTSGTFDYKNPRWKIDGLRHLLTPRISYRYIPEADAGRARIPQIDREAFVTYLQPLGLGDIRNIDDLHATNTLRFAVDNILQTRDRDTGTRDLLQLNLAADFRFAPRLAEDDVSEIHADLAVMPAHWLQADVYTSVSPRTGKLREFNSGLTVRDGKVWSLRFGNNYLNGQIEDYLIDARYQLSERFGALTRLHYDARGSRFTEQAYGVSQNLGNMWLLSYVVTLYSGRSRESDFGFNVQIKAIGF